MSKELIILHGKPGSGKTSTAGFALGRASLDRFDEVNHLSVGSHLRAIAQGQYDSCFYDALTGDSQALRSAQPVSHDVVNGVVGEYLRRTRSRSFTLVDGYPKYQEQIPPFQENVRSAGGNILAVVGIEVPDEVAVARMIGRGTRPGEEAIAADFATSRLEEHATGYAVTAGVMADMYPAHTIDGVPSQEVVAEHLAYLISEITHQ